jgi:hypothetical protein
VKQTIRTALIGAALTCLAAGVEASPYVIGGTPYYETGPTESVTAVFTQADGGVSLNTYAGLVKLVVSGTGQSAGANFNDAFYVYTPVPSHNASWYQLAMDNVALVPLNPSQNAKNFIVYDIDAGVQTSPVYVPAYRADHTYSFIVNLGLLGVVSPSLLHFGVSNGIFADNTGQYAIQITQLVPEPAMLTLVGLGLLGVARRRPRR